MKPSCHPSVPPPWLPTGERVQGKRTWEVLMVPGRPDLFLVPMARLTAG